MKNVNATFKTIGDLSGIYAQIEAARKAYREEHPDEEPRIVLSERDIEKAKLADLFARRYSVLRSYLPFINAPYGALFAQYETRIDGQVRAYTTASRFAERLLDRVLDDARSSAGLIFVGTPGTGKTHLALSILQKLKEMKAPGFFLPASMYFDLFNLESKYKLDAPLWKVFQLLSGVSCLVLDDVGTDSWTDARRSRLQQIIDARAGNKLPTVITSNLSRADFANGGAERLISRFDQFLYPIVATWEDYRKKNALKNLSPEELF